MSRYALEPVGLVRIGCRLDAASIITCDRSGTMR